MAARILLSCLTEQVSAAMKKILVSVLSQIIPIMIGVYLGFALNNFGESQKLNRKLDTYTEMLKNEISDNLDQVQGVQEYHVSLGEDFQKLLRSEDLTTAFREYTFMGLKPGFVNNSAYNTGIQTGIIQEFPLEQIQSINRLYTLQNRYTTFNDNLISTFMSQKFPETESEIRSMLISMVMNMNDIRGFESELVGFYSDILEEI